MSLISTAKAKAARGSMKEAFRNEAGAIDLASIMVGIIVIGLIGGVIAATVFAVIPWAQDNAAKQQLDSVVAAQSAAIGLGADTGAVSYPSPATGTNTLTKDSRTLFNGGTTNDLGIKSNGTSGTGARYAAIVKSASGNYFRITDQNTKPVQVNAPTSGTPATAVSDLKTVSYSAITGLTAAS